MLLKLTLCFIFLPVFVIAQTEYKGTVVNKRTQLKISFATVGLLKENIGTSANEDGVFSLNSYKAYPNDTLVVSCVGYKTHKVAINAVYSTKNYFTIFLDEVDKTLDEVIVSNKRNATTLNDFKKCSNSFITTSGYQTQLAQHFVTSFKNARLTKIKICRYSSILFGVEKTLFRIRVYNMDSLTKTPKNDLVNEIIEVKSSSKLIEIDITKYNVHILDNDFFIAVEWLKIPYNEIKWKGKKDRILNNNITYNPSIGWSDNMNLKMEAWGLDYNGKWHSMSSTNRRTSIAISATLKY